MAVYFNKDRNRWYFQFRRRINGRVITAAKLLPEGWRRTQAQTYDRQETARLYAVASGVEPETHLIDTAVAHYIEERCTVLKNGKCAAQNIALLVPDFEGRPFTDLPEIFTEYQKRERERLKPATIRNRLAYLRAAARYAFRTHKIGDADTLARLTVPQVKNFRTNRASQEEVQRIVQHLKAAGHVDTAAIVTLARYTAQRWVAEILALQEVRTINGAPWIECGKTKNGDPNLVPIRHTDKWTLKHIPFTGGQSMHYDRYKEACRAIGRPDLWMHDLRRSWASDILSSGGTIDDVQTGLNQKSRQAAERYAWMDIDRKRALFLHTGKPQKKVKKRA